MQRGYTAAEVSRLAGFETQMMLNYLERVGIFEPEIARQPHHGKKRQYTFRDLIVLRAINRLLVMGARPKRISEAIKTFQKIEQLPNDIDSLMEFSRKSSMFIVNKDSVLYCDTPEAIVDLTKGGQLELAFVLDIPMTLSGVAKTAKDYNDRRPSGHTPKRSILERLSKQHGI